MTDKACPNCKSGVKTACWGEKFVCSLCQGSGRWNPNWLADLAASMRDYEKTQAEFRVTARQRKISPRSD